MPVLFLCISPAAERPRPLRLRTPANWLSKVLVFNKLIGGTAPHLLSVLQHRLEPIFAEFLSAQLKARGGGSRDDLAGRVREHMKSGLARIKATMSAWRPEWCHVPAEFEHEDFAKHRGKHLVDAYHDTILGRAKQSLFLTRCVLDVDTPSDSLVRSWVESQVVEPVKKVLMHVVDDLVCPSRMQTVAPLYSRYGISPSGSGTCAASEYPELSHCTNNE